MVPPPAAVHGLLRWPTPVLPAIHRSFSPPQPCLRRHPPLPLAWPCPWRRRPLWSSRGLVRGGCRCHARFADFPGVPAPQMSGTPVPTLPSNAALRTSVREHRLLGCRQSARLLQARPPQPQPPQPPQPPPPEGIASTFAAAVGKSVRGGHGYCRVGCPFRERPPPRLPAHILPTAVLSKNNIVILCSHVYRDFVRNNCTLRPSGWPHLRRTASFWVIQRHSSSAAAIPSLLSLAVWSTTASPSAVCTDLSATSMSPQGRLAAPSEAARYPSGARSPRPFSDLIRDGRRRSPLPAARPQ